MIGLLIGLAATWLLLRFEGKSLGVLGFNAPAARATQFAVGFLVAALFAIAQQSGISLASGVPWKLNPELSTALVRSSLRSNILSVLTEELLFRGYFFYQAIRFLGPQRASLLGAAAFGVYHWFSYGLLGNPVAMVFVFLFTGAFGYMACRAFIATGGLALPIGVHLGWNLLISLGFSGGGFFGKGIFVPDAKMVARDLSYIGLNIVLPLLLVAAVTWAMRPVRTAASPP
jgi:membrane protease YdiL (CAAX protease family)